MTTQSAGDLFADLVRVETRVYNAVGERLRAEHGIVASQFELLRHLRDHPGSRVADLADAFAIGVGATSKGIDRYERLGWVVRTANPADRRSSVLSLTEAGADLVDRAERTFDAALGETIGRELTDDETAVIGPALRRLRRALERDRVGLPTG